MELAILFDHRFYRSKGQTIFSPTSYSYSFFQKRYLTVFDQVSVIARVADVPGGPVRAHEPTEGPAVKVVDLGDWTGTAGFLKSRHAIVRATRQFMDRGAAFVLIAPGNVCSLAFGEFVRRTYPFVLEVVGDPWDAYGPGAMRHPLRPILRRWSARCLRQQCRLADAALYVTRHALQRRYPCAGSMAGVSDVVLPAEAYAAGPRTFDRKPLTVVSVGSIAHLYKGQDILIDAVQVCIQRGLDLRLVLVGDGRRRGEMERRAEAAGIASRVRFVGELYPASAVREQLDQADLFILPSRQEGLPRALVEAMARGLPCIASCVGGIPELLSETDLVPPRDAGALADRIAEVASDRPRMAEMSRRNWRKAADYEEQSLIGQRTGFYRKVKDRLSGRLSSHPAVGNGPADGSGSRAEDFEQTQDAHLERSL